MIIMYTYFNIMADTAGYGGRTVSPLSGLNRTNDLTVQATRLHGRVDVV